MKPKLKFLLFLCLLSSGIFAQGDPYNNLNGHNTIVRISGYNIRAIINNPALPFADSNSIPTTYAIKTYVDNHSGGDGGGAVNSVNGQTGDVTITIPDVSGKLNKNDSVLANRITTLETALASLRNLVGQKQDTSFVDTLELDYGLLAVNNKQLFLQQNISNNINPKSATSYTLDSSDIGKVLTFNNSSGITLTIPSGLRVGFNCTIIQTGTGQVTFSGDGVTIIQSNSYTKTLKQYSVVRLNCFATNTYVLDGEMQ